MQARSLLEKIRALPPKKKNTLMAVSLIFSGLLVFGALDLTVSSQMKDLAINGGGENAENVFKKTASQDQTETLSPIQGLLDNFKSLKDIGMEKTAEIKLGNKATDTLYGILEKTKGIWKKITGWYK